MVIEERLKSALSEIKEAASLPPGLDVQVRERAEKAFRRLYVREKESRPRRKLTYKLAVLALAVAVACGFGYSAVQWLHTSENHGIRVETYMDSSMMFTQISAAEIRSELMKVTDKLQQGESANVYFEALTKEKNKQLRDYAMMGITKPVIELNWEQWNRQVTGERQAIGFPEAIGEFVFDGGKSGNVFNEFGYSPSTYKEEIEELKRMAKETGEAVVWNRTEPDGAFPTYTAQYKSPAGDILFATLTELSQEAVKIVGTNGAGTEHQVLTVGEEEANYTAGPHFMSDTDYYQRLSWVVEKNGNKYWASLSSTSVGVTGEQLARWAEEYYK